MPECSVDIWLDANQVVWSGMPHGTVKGPRFWRVADLSSGSTFIVYMICLESHCFLLSRIGMVVLTVWVEVRAGHREGSPYACWFPSPFFIQSLT